MIRHYIWPRGAIFYSCWEARMLAAFFVVVAFLVELESGDALNKLNNL